jgi:hypothetical protein
MLKEPPVAGKLCRWIALASLPSEFHTYLLEIASFLAVCYRPDEDFLDDPALVSQPRTPVNRCEMIQT